MTLHDDAAYLALKTHDARFDGRLFVGVTSTGIYCRPVCRVRTPLRRNCQFFANAASAERGGFRPCLRCRPELSPGLSLADSSQVLAQHAARLIELAARSGADPYLPDIAAQLGVTDRHLRRIFRLAHGVTPIDYLSTQRLLLAKQLLTDTDMPVTQVALASGHASLRRFNAAFMQRYRMNPSALRKQAASTTKRRSDSAMSLRLAYRPPYDIDGVMRFLGQRALPGVETVEGLEVRRTLRWLHQGQWLQGWLQCRFVPLRNELQLGVAPALLPAVGSIMQRLRHALDLDADPSLIGPCLATMPVPAPAGLRVPGAMDGFETATRIILGQQVTVAAARTLTRRLVDELGQDIHTPFAELNRLFPSAADMAGAARRAHRPAGHRASACRGAAGTGPRGGRRPHRVAPCRTAGRHAAGAARAARHRRMDRAADRHARAGLARCLCGQRHRRAQRAGHARRGAGAGPSRSLAPLARLCRDGTLADLGGQDMRLHDLVAQARLQSPLGPMTVAATALGLAGLWFDGQAHHPGVLDAPLDPMQPYIAQAREELDHYWRGDLRGRFKVRLDAQGTPFQRAVWRTLLDIPAGHTTTYAAVAADAGSARAVRAAGAAIGRNPLSIIVPCHRVLGRDGSLTGYAGGLERKQALLQLEGALPRHT